MIFKSLPVLMYHQVISNGEPDALCVTTEQLTKQLQHICDKGYTAISVQQLIDHYYLKTPLPKKPVLLTFDDGYQNNFTNLYPLLIKLNLKATIFLTPHFIAQHSIGSNTYLSFEEIKQMDEKYIEFALHTFSHQSYSELSLPDITTDIEKTIAWFSTANIPLTPAHAYTYGAFPRDDKDKRLAMTKILQQKGVKMAFRIGNRLNFLPLKDPFFIQRIDIRGTDSFAKFRRKLQFGAKYLLF